MCSNDTVGGDRPEDSVFTWMVVLSDLGVRKKGPSSFVSEVTLGSSKTTYLVIF